MARILQGRFGKAANHTNLFTSSEQESIARLFQKGQMQNVLSRMDCQINTGQTIYKLFGEYEEVPFPLVCINKSNDPATGLSSFTVSAWILDEYGDPDTRSIRHLSNFNSVFHYLDGMIDLKFGRCVDRFHDETTKQNQRKEIDPVCHEQEHPSGPSLP